MFASRIAGDLAPNRLTEAVRHRRAAGAPIIDLTESNPTRVGLDYPPDLLAPLADCRGLTYAPQPFGIIDGASGGRLGLRAARHRDRAPIAWP